VVVAVLADEQQAAVEPVATAVQYLHLIMLLLHQGLRYQL
jgi:hypothetical protein